MVGEMHSADLVSTSPCWLFIYLGHRAKASDFFRSCSAPLLSMSWRGQLARLHHRPPSQPTRTDTPKHSETSSDVITDGSGPEANRAPSLTSTAWVKSVGISSQ